MSTSLSGRRILGASALLVIAVLLGRWTTARGDGIAYSPNPLLIDAPYQEVLLPDAGRITDAHMRNDRLYVLDGFKQQISVLDVTSGRVMRQFSRQGSGPGELQRATALAASPGGDTIAVLDQRLLSLFTDSGTFIERETVLLPCATGLATLAWTEAGMYVSGNCLAVGADTMQATLWRLDDEWKGVEEAAMPQYTMSGTWGTPFGWPRRISETADGLLFGSGIDACPLLIGTEGTRSLCATAEAPFSAPAPPDFPPSPLGQPALRWPDPLPMIWDAVMLDGRLLILRPFRHDSLVARLVDSDGTASDLFTASSDGFVRCRSDACIWRTDTIDGAQIHILRLSDLSSALAALSSSPPPAGAR